MTKEHQHHWIRQNQPGHPNIEVCSGCGVERSQVVAPPAPKPAPAPKRK